MVWLAKSVECFAKIAMRTLHCSRTTMDLLPDHDLLRLILPEAFLCLVVCNIVNHETARPLGAKQNVDSGAAD